MKELLEQLAKGESTVEDVLKAIDDADKEKVPRSRLNDKIAEVKELEGQLKERDSQLTDLGKKAKDNEELTAEIDRLKQENAQKDEEYQSKLQQQTFDAKLSDALRDAKAKNPRAVKALLNTEGVKLDGEKLLGLDDQLSALKESDAYLFADAEEKPALKGRAPHTGEPNKPPAGITKDQFNQMGYRERAELYQQQPDIYKQLAE